MAIATYLTAFTILKNLKRRMIYRREIIALRGIANTLMDSIYNDKTVCPLDSNKANFSKYESIPSVALLIGMGFPFLMYMFLLPIGKAYDLTYLILPVTILTMLFATIKMLELLSHHKIEMFIGLKLDPKRNERYLKKIIRRHTRSVKRQKNYKNLTAYIRLTIILTILSLLYSHNPIVQDKSNFSFILNSVVESSLTLITIYLLIKRKLLVIQKTVHISTLENVIAKFKDKK
ncbi:hypothetical protein [Sulfurimonas sp.]